jgi:hypothetical protein
VDLAGPTKYPDLDLAAQGVTDLDWVSISASGTYLVVNGTITGCTTVSGYCDASKVFTRNGAAVGPFWSEYGRPSHYDLTLDAAGADVAVGVAKSAPNEGKVIMRRLSDGLVTALNAGGYSQHHSARNLARPGWAYVSHPYNGPNWPPFRNEVFAVKLDGSQQIERIAHLHATTPTYESQPQVVPSPDGKRVIFASNWDVSSGPVQAYVADVRSMCAACSFSLASSSQAVAATGGTFTASLSTTSNCSWAASSNMSWMTVAQTSTQNGAGTVSYTVAPNTTTSSRTGTLTIAGQTFTVTQAQASAVEAPSGLIAQMIQPGNGATNVDPTVNFTWTKLSLAEGYRLQIGASYGASELLNSSTTHRTWLDVEKVKLPRRTILYARLWTRAGGVWRSSDSTFALR